MKTQDITQFIEDNDVFLNMILCTITYNGIQFKGAEYYYQYSEFKMLILNNGSENILETPTAKDTKQTAEKNGIGM